MDYRPAIRETREEIQRIEREIFVLEANGEYGSPDWTDAMTHLHALQDDLDYMLSEIED